MRNAFTKKNLQPLLLITLFLMLINAASERFFHRFDLTSDRRYTLSQTSLDIVKSIKEPLTIDVFLEGKFPGEFKKLQTETQQMLQEFRACNSNIAFRFVNPLDDSQDAFEKRQLIYTIFRLDNPHLALKDIAEVKASINKLTDVDKALTNSFSGSGMTPARVTLNDHGKQTEEIVFPWAIASYHGRSVRIPLLKAGSGATTAEKVVASVQHLEYAFANAMNTVSKDRQKKIAVIKGNGELADIFMADFIKSVRENYFIGTFTMDSVAKKPNESLRYLQKYDLIVVAKPTERFSDEEKLALDQFVVNGGKSLWLVDQVNMEMDSLYNEYGATLAFPNDLNLNDMFFKYGVRINPDLVKDVLATPVALATGERGSATQYTQYPWLYAPLVFPASKNPIVSNIDGVKFEFASGIDTLRNGIRKTVLLKSSPYSKRVGAPVEVKLAMVSERPEQSEFSGKGSIPMAVLLEGKFHSVFENRVLPFQEKTFRPIGKRTGMIVVSDGDVIRNQVDKAYQPLELGFDKWTNKLYGNKEFMLNCVNYLLDDNGLINIRSKEVKLPLLDREKVYANYTKLQVLTIGMPVVLLLVFSVAFTYLRKRRYSH